ncbi:hypothetical protein BN1708_006978 [Verticillium longisporum]|uniref:Uncharacterized protein n=1 Tax=Verticillium longisporum TaxID=100787 RepID=A0A0G4MPS7_VERLO|nr:hypothetical protein BN1708_006978 [Verticillium longisporum]
MRRHEDELQFLASLKQGLQDASDLEVLGQQVQRRIDNLESGLTTTPTGSIIATTQYDAAPSPGEAIASGSPSLGTPPSVTNLSKRTRESSSSENAEPTTVRRREGTLSSQSAATLRCLESLAWGRFTGPCYPHRRCNCMRYRTYAELASVNCDTRDVYLQWSPTNIDPKILLPNNYARRLVKDFHMQHLWWHHNGFHSDTFLEQCEIFWTSGAVVHPLWMALYLAVTCTSLWSLANSPRQCRELGLAFDDSLIELQFRKLTEILYEEDFLQNPSTGERLRKRACDVLAAKCATLIEVLLSVEEELVIKVMRMRDGTIEEKQREAIDELIASQGILAKFLDLDPVFGMRPMFWESPAASETWDPAVLYDVEQFEDFDVWYNEVFSGVVY